MFGYSFVNGYKKDREMAKSDNIEKSGHLVKILGKVINTSTLKSKISSDTRKLSFCATGPCSLQMSPSTLELQTSRLCY